MGKNEKYVSQKPSGFYCNNSDPTHEYPTEDKLRTYCKYIHCSHRQPGARPENLPEVSPFAILLADYIHNGNR